MRRTLYGKTLEIGSLLFADVDQIDLTGPFEVLARIPNASHRLYGQTTDIVRDVKGLVLKADAILSEAPALDILHIPGGLGQEAIGEDEAVLEWIRFQARHARIVFSVCTGALILGAAGLLVGRRATTHWAAFHILPHYGAEAIDERVVVDGTLVTAAGVTAGIDGALRVAAIVAGDDVAQQIQLEIAYAPEPPFDAGTPRSAPPHILEAATQSFAAVAKRREATAARFARSLLASPTLTTNPTGENV